MNGFQSRMDTPSTEASLATGGEEVDHETVMQSFQEFTELSPTRVDSFVFPAAAEWPLSGVVMDEGG